MKRQRSPSSRDRLLSLCQRPLRSPLRWQCGVTAGVRPQRSPRLLRKQRKRRRQQKCRLRRRRNQHQPESQPRKHQRQSLSQKRWPSGNRCADLPSRRSPATSTPMARAINIGQLTNPWRRRNRSRAGDGLHGGSTRCRCNDSGASRRRITSLCIRLSPRSCALRRR